MLRADASIRLVVTSWGRMEDDIYLGLEPLEESAPGLPTPNQLVGLAAHVMQEAGECLQAQEGRFHPSPP
jgi:hypothetical protein